MGRNFGGIHYRSDVMAGFRLGEDIAVAKMQDLVNILTEDVVGFQFTRLDVTQVQIAPGNEAPLSIRLIGPPTPALMRKRQEERCNKRRRNYGVFSSAARSGAAGFLF